MDQNPDDRLVNMIERHRNLMSSIKHVRLSKPGLSEARNIGIKIAKGDIIGFPDDDCWYEAKTVAYVRRVFTGDESLSGVVADWVEQTNGGGNNQATNTDLLSLDAWRNFRGGAASSIALFLKRRLLVDLQGFDDRLGVGKWYGASEETDLILRALAAGANIKRANAAKVHHAFAPTQQSSSHIKPDAQRARARGTGAMYAKHHLPIKTVARGLVAPVLKPLARMQFGHPLQLGWATALGRLEGMRRWHKEEPDA